MRRPPNGGAPDAATSRGAKGKDQQRDQIVAPLGVERDAALIARADAAGTTLRRIDADTWYASRWNLVARIDDASIEQWVDRATGVRP